MRKTMRKHFELVSTRGALVTELITPRNHPRIWEAYAERGIVLPSYSGIMRRGMRHDELYIIHSNYAETIRLNGHEYTLKTSAGFIYDKNSVPRFLRSFVDNDDPQLEASAWWHDPCFALHLVPFREANKIHFWRGRWEKNGAVSSVLSFLAVRSIVGRRSYRKNDPSTHWQRDFVRFWVDGVRTW